MDKATLDRANELTALIEEYKSLQAIISNSNAYINITGRNNTTLPTIVRTFLGDCELQLLDLLQTEKDRCSRELAEL